LVFARKAAFDQNSEGGFYFERRLGFITAQAVALGVFGFSILNHPRDYVFRSRRVEIGTHLQERDQSVLDAVFSDSPPCFCGRFVNRRRPRRLFIESVRRHMEACAASGDTTGQLARPIANTGKLTAARLSALDIVGVLEMQLPRRIAKVQRRFFEIAA
jgi:hypothetical protein